MEPKIYCMTDEWSRNLDAVMPQEINLFFTTCYRSSPAALLFFFNA
jgi:hypothetical protein